MTINSNCRVCHFGLAEHNKRQLDQCWHYLLDSDMPLFQASGVKNE